MLWYVYTGKNRLRPKSEDNDMYDIYIIHVNDFANICMSMQSLSVPAMSAAAVVDDIYDFDIT